MASGRVTFTPGPVAPFGVEVGHDPVGDGGDKHATHDRSVALAELVDRVITAPSESERAMDAR